MRGAARVRSGRVPARPPLLVRAAVLSAALAALVGAPGAALADPEPCGAGAPPGCVVDHGLALLGRGAAQDGLTWLKDRRTAAAADERHPFALAQAYLAVDNRIWARRTLLGVLAERPGDCEARAWLTWVLVLGGDLDGALAQLDEPPCPADAPGEARWQLLRAFVERERQRPDEARAALTGALAADAVYREDVGLLDHLERALWPGREPPLAVHAELKVGWSSEPRLGSPADPRDADGGAGADDPDEVVTVADDASGLVTEVGLTARLGYRALPWLEPFAELEGRGVVFSSEPAWGLSYLRPGGRGGLALALGPSVTLRAAYRFDALLLAGGDDFGGGPVWYARGHTGELDLAVGSSVTILASGGHREYRPMGRTRWEARLRVGGGLPLGPRVFLLATLAAELNRARNPAYHLWGGTALAEVDVDLGRAWSARARMAVGLDWYPDSAAAPEFGTGDEARRDILLRPALALWTPTWGGVRFALAWEPSWQLSTAPAYEFVDQRALLYVRWGLRDDPWRPRAVAAAGHVPLPHGFAGGSGSEESLSERIRELLRQDEEAQRASTCVD